LSAIVCGIGASHNTLMNTHWDDVDHLPGAHQFRDGLAEARDALAACEPDSVVVIGSNHFRGMFLDLMPAFSVGVGDVIAAGEAGTPSGPLPVDTELAAHLLSELVGCEVDAAFSLRMTVDHGISHALQYLTPALDVPVVPIVVNTFAPPLPSVRRCWDVGRAIGAAIASDGQEKRVAIIGSGGLSHQLPWPNWSDPQSEDDDFLVEAWLNGRESWSQYDARRREIVLKGIPEINSDFDRWFLELVGAVDVGPVLDRTWRQLQEEVGNGGQEIRTWIAMVGALSSSATPMHGRTLAYAPIPRWLTGMGVSLCLPVEDPAP
jgi:2,3-dihydroxyphenylpropionate 1,2-dioxygenase